MACKRTQGKFMEACSAVLTVMVVEDNESMRKRLCQTIAAQPNMRIGQACDCVKAALEWIRTNKPDLLLADLGLPDGNGVDVIRKCSVLYPDCNILVITVFGDEQNVLSAIEAGATGYLLKDADDIDIGRAMKDVLAGGSPMSPIIARKVLDRALSRHRPNVISPDTAPSPFKTALTRRETETLNVIARGYTYEETAAMLGISLSTVQTHIRGIYGKLAVTSRTGAVLEAHKRGLLAEDLFNMH